MLQFFSVIFLLKERILFMIETNHGLLETIVPLGHLAKKSRD